LANGELAINITDGKLYYKDNGGVVQVLATKGAGTIGGSTTQIQYNNAGALAGNAAMVFNSGTNTTTLTTLNLTNALGAIYGGTAQSAYTQGDVLYASATNTLSKLGIGTVNYILTSTGSVPQWVAPSSVTVNTATNLAGGAGGSVPYQSAADTTTFLAIGTANRVMTSSGTAPQWVTALTGLTGVSSSSITNTSLTSGRVVYSGASGVETDSASLTFNGTTLSAGGFSTTGLSTLVQTVKIGDSNFSGVAVFAAATPAKLYVGTGTVTDTTSAIGATNAVGAVSSLAITPIAATNTSVTYTNAATLYIAGAPSAGTNVTLTNPYSLYVAAGAAYFGGAVTVAGSLSLAAVTVTSLTDSGLTSGRVTFATTAGLLTDSANLLYSGTDLTVYGLTVGRGAGAVATNTAVGNGALVLNSTGAQIASFGLNALYSNTTGSFNTALGSQALTSSTTSSNNTAVGTYSMLFNTTGASNTAVGSNALYSNTTASNNTAVGYKAAFSNTTATATTAIGYQAANSNTTTNGVTAIGAGAAQTLSNGNTNNYGEVYVGDSAGLLATTATDVVSVGSNSLRNSTTGSKNVAVGAAALYSNTTASYNTAVGYQAGYNTTGTSNTFLGYQAGYLVTTGTTNTCIGLQAGFGTTNLTTGTNNTLIGAGASTSAGGDTYSITVCSNSVSGKGSSTGFIAPGSAGTGAVYQGNNSTLWAITSDQRLKKNIVDNNTGLSVINQIQVRNFEYRLPEEITEVPQNQAIAKTGIQLGVIAQELQQILPECVKTESTGVMTVDADNLTWYLVNAVKELKSQLDSVKAELATLKGA
jgi:hypothetical protein